MRAADGLHIILIETFIYLQFIDNKCDLPKLQITYISAKMMAIKML